MFPMILHKRSSNAPAFKPFIAQACRDDLHSGTANCIMNSRLLDKQPSLKHDVWKANV